MIAPLAAVGDVLHHPAFGFARVQDVDTRGVSLHWERQGPSHPTHVSAAGLGAAYRRCLPDGLFSRAVRDPDGARALADQEPLTLLALLLGEVEGPLEVNEVRDWYLALRLVSAERFDRAWEALRPLVEADQRFALVRGRVELAPGVDRERLRDPPPRPLLPAGGLRGAGIFPAALRLARALAEVHLAGGSVVPDRAAITIVGDRIVYTVRPEVGPPRPSSRRDDVRFIARLLLEQIVGPLPAPDHVPNAELVTHVGGSPVLPLELMAVLTDCLADDPLLRPADGLALWERVHAAESVAALRAVAPWAARATLSAGFDTHIGLVKSLQSQTNQDSFLLLGERTWSLTGVADGISQCNAGSGDLASGLTVKALRTWWTDESEALRDSNPARVHAATCGALARANEAVCQAAIRLARPSDEDFHPMGSTVVLALTRGNRVHLLSLGDSRAYLVGRHGVSLLTTDQNLQSERFAAAVDGHPVEWGASGAPLVAYVGHYADDGTIGPARPLTRTVTLLPGEWLILCSDGLTDYAAPEEAALVQLLESTVRGARGATGNTRAMDVARTLVDAANRGGGGDNITVLALTLSSDPPPVPPPGSLPS